MGGGHSDKKEETLINIWSLQDYHIHTKETNWRKINNSNTSISLAIFLQGKHSIYISINISVHLFYYLDLKEILYIISVLLSLERWDNHNSEKLIQWIWVSLRHIQGSLTIFPCPKAPRYVIDTHSSTSLMCNFSICNLK